MNRFRGLLAVLLFAAAFDSLFAATPPASDRFQPMDVFGLEWASDPQISPDGRRVAYVRNSMDVMKDRRRAQIWLIDAEGGEQSPLTSGGAEFAPRWSPDGRRLVYVAREGETLQVFVRWMETGATTRLAQLLRAPSGVAWSPDGKSIAFSMLIPEKPEPLAKMPVPPEGAEWAKPPKVITRVVFRADGEGFLEEGFNHLFVVPADGGTPRQLTSGSFHHDGPLVWTPDGKFLLFSANRRADWEIEAADSEIYEIAVADGKLRALTDRRGPDNAPAVSPDGRSIAWLGYDDRFQGYQVTHLYVMNRDGSGAHPVAGDYDRDIEQPKWSRDGKRIYFATADQGNGKIGWVAVDAAGSGGAARSGGASGAGGAKPEILASDLGGGDLGRPYGGGSYSVATATSGPGVGRFAYTWTRPERPPELAVAGPGLKTSVLTRLNDDLFTGKRLASVESLWVESSFDHRKIEGWIVKPPDFDATKKYPMILEIHGGPFADYGDRFGAEMQLYAAAGYVVLYTNPRGSTSYGEEFGNLIHHAYPGNDYDDLMSAVDAVVGRGYVDPANLFVTGGSGGGVLTAWIVGKTDRFRAAVSAKPVINWSSFVLTSDGPNFFTRYWFASPFWEHPEEYIRRSPLSLVGNVKTPTMLLTGEADYRTPISESEQFYEALKLRRIDTALVRIPDASHEMISRPSWLIAKSAHILAWFEKYRKPGTP